MCGAPSFERSARGFANDLSRLLTRTVTYQPLVCDFVGDGNVVLIRFRPEHRYVELGNGSFISVLQRVVPDPEAVSGIRIAAYSYSYALGPNPDEDWLVRYDYVPEMAARPDYPYPASHVHINATSEPYEAFAEASGRRRPLSQVHFPTGCIGIEDLIEHLIVEFDVPVLYGRSKEEALGILAESRRLRERRIR